MTFSSQLLLALFKVLILLASYGSHLICFKFLKFMLDSLICHSLNNIELQKLLNHCQLENSNYSCNTVLNNGHGNCCNQVVVILAIMENQGLISATWKLSCNNLIRKSLFNSLHYATIRWCEFIATSLQLSSMYQ